MADADIIVVGAGLAGLVAAGIKVMAAEPSEWNHAWSNQSATGSHLTTLGLFDNADLVVRDVAENVGDAQQHKHEQNRTRP